ncbi:MAG: hypothetical protein RBT49_01170 [Bacteroidales bacterium]|jgi:SPASM domain peptide maturase of grasp-with-spasm system|nr:hypothetical protein [Bacteroidales bacterium]
MKNKNEYFSLFPNYIPIKGKHKCILADINNGEYFKIPELVFEVLNINIINSYNLNQLNRHFNNKYEDGIKGYFDYFVKNKIGFYLKTNWQPAKISYEYKSPFKATNAIIEVENLNKYCITTLIKDLINLGCHEIEIRIINYNTLISILDILKKFQCDMVRSFYLNYLQENGKENLKIEKDIEKEIISNLKINQIKIFNSNNNTNTNNNKILHIAQSFFEDYGQTGLIINPSYFYESQNFNASLNQKIVVDKEGNIKNYLNHKRTFGNVNNIIISDILFNSDFTKIWHISNDKIEICKECQYRYFCLNFSEILKKNNKYFKINYCKNIFLN